MLRLDAIPKPVALLLGQIGSHEAYPELAPIDKMDGHRLVSLPDLAAMKLNAIANRGSKKDFYDMEELLKHYTLSEMLGFFSRKYPNTDPFAVVRSLAWFEEADQEPDPIPIRSRCSARPGNR